MVIMAKSIAARIQLLKKTQQVAENGQMIVVAAVAVVAAVVDVVVGAVATVADENVFVLCPFRKYFAFFLCPVVSQVTGGIQKFCRSTKDFFRFRGYSVKECKYSFSKNLRAVVEVIQ